MADYTNLPNQEFSVRETFGIDSDMKVMGYADADPHTPPVDADYLFDRNTTLAILAGPIGGPIAAVLTALPLAALRYRQGGVGMATGLAGIVLNALAGVAYAAWLARQRRPFRLGDFVVLSLIGAVCLLLSVLFMPSRAVAERFLRDAVPTIILVNAVGTVLVGLVVHNDRERRDTAYRLRSLMQRAPGTLYQRVAHPDGSLSYHFASFAIDRLLGESPHADELYDEHEKVRPEVRATEDAIDAMVAEELRRAGVGQPELLTRLLLDAAWGIKRKARDPGEVGPGIRLLVERLVGPEVRR